MSGLSDNESQAVVAWKGLPTTLRNWYTVSGGLYFKAENTGLTMHITQVTQILIWNKANCYEKTKAHKMALKHFFNAHIICPDHSRSSLTLLHAFKSSFIGSLKFRWSQITLRYAKTWFVAKIAVFDEGPCRKGSAQQKFCCDTRELSNFLLNV